MGLRSRKKDQGTYLSIAGGSIWNKSVTDKSHPDYDTQEYAQSDGSTGIRQGARYDDMTGVISNVKFRSHDQYGDSIAVYVTTPDSEKYIISTSLNNSYAQSLLKGLLLIDLDRQVFINPYDFITNDKKRRQGVSFRVGGPAGEKINLRDLDLPSSFNKDQSFWSSGNKRAIKRHFEDLTDYLVAEITSSVLPKFSKAESVNEDPGTESDYTESIEVSAPKAVEPKVEAKVEDKPESPPAKKPSLIAMKKAIKAYISENYEGQELPSKMPRQQVETWYQLVLEEEELPFEDNSDELSDDDLQSQIDSLL